MQDTAEGFGQPIRQVFEPFFRMRARSCRRRSTRRRATRVKVEDHFWHWLYLPIARAAEFVRPAGRPAAAGPHLGLPDLQLRHAARAAVLRPMTAYGVLSPSCCSSCIALLLAPLLVGWVNQCRAWLQNRSGAAAAAALPHAAQAVHARTRCVAAQRLAAVPRRALRRVRLHVLRRGDRARRSSTDLPFAPAADAIALVGLFALARVFIALAAMDIGTAFGSLGARREMLVGFLAEPALLMVLFTASLISQLDLAADHRRHAGAPRARDLPQPRLRRRRVHDGVAGRERAHSGRQPGHAPRAHDDPRGDDPRVLGAPPGADRVGGGLKLFAYSCIGLALFFPWGIAAGSDDWLAILLALRRRWSRSSRVGGFAAGADRDAVAPRCASSARRSSSAPRSCWRCWRCWSTCCWEAERDRWRPALRPVHQPASRRCCCCSRSPCWRSGACCR